LKEVQLYPTTTSTSFASLRERTLRPKLTPDIALRLTLAGLETRTTMHHLDEDWLRHAAMAWPRRGSRWGSGLE